MENFFLLFVDTWIVKSYPVMVGMKSPLVIELERQLVGVQKEISKRENDTERITMHNKLKHIRINTGFIRKHKTYETSCGTKKFFNTILYI